MTPKVPYSELYERDGLWFPRTRLTVGGWVVAGFKNKVMAEGSLKNLNYAFEHGWRAREAEMRRSLDIDK